MKRRQKTFALPTYTSILRDIYIKNEELCIRNTTRECTGTAKLCKSARAKFLMKICNLGFPRAPETSSPGHYDENVNQIAARAPSDSSRPKMPRICMETHSHLAVSVCLRQERPSPAS